MHAIRCRTSSALTFALLTVLASASRGRSCLGQSWVDRKVCRPFVCQAEFPLARLDGLLGELDQLQADLVRYLGVPPAREPIEVYLFRDKQSYSGYLRRHLPNVPYRRALYVKKRGPGMVLAYQNREFQTDLRHECTHALLHAVLPVVPLWLDEGLAEYFEVPPRERAFGNPHLSSLRWSLRLGMVPRLENLEKKAGLSEMGKNEYRDSWAWVHFMLHGPKEAHNELVGFLRDIRASTPPGLLSGRLQRRVPDTQKRFVTHFNNWK